MRHSFSSARPMLSAHTHLRSTRSVLLLMVGLLVITLFPAAPAAKAVVPFTPTDCPTGALVEGLQVDCGFLTVPESRRNFTGKTIQLAVAILRSPNPNKAPDPAVFLQGGPGGATLVLAPALAALYTPTLLQRDIILMDQRGTGYSQPRLDCSFAGQAPQQRTMPRALQEDQLPDFVQLQVDLLTACGQAYRAAGVDLSAYNTVENAADFEDLRLALGYGPWNVIGASYGTRLALTMLRYRPETLRSVVLESVYPFQANFHVDAFSSYNGTLQRLAAECAADPACNAAYPDLLGTFDSLYERLNANPAQVPIFNTETGEIATYLPVTGVDVSLITFQLFYSTEIIPLLPALIGETGKGNYELLGLIVSLLFASVEQQDPGAAQAVGMLYAVQCNEDAPFASREDFIAARDANRRAAALAFQVTFNEGVLDVCEGFGLTNPDPAENAPVVSDRPVMIVSGANDPITPPSYAEAAASTLSNSFIVSYPRGGHGPSLGSACLAVAVADFIATPATRPDPSACIAEEAPLPFIVPQTLQSEAFGQLLDRASQQLRFQGR